MDVKFINPFLNATKNVIETMASIPVTAGKPGIKKDHLSWGAVSGLIGMAGGNVQGSMVLSFQKSTILAIVSGMLGEDAPDLNQEVVDAVGEITNMICGGTKRELEDLGYMFDMALPTVIVGEKVEISQMTKGPIVVIPFSTPNGDFVVEACINSRAE